MTCKAVEPIPPPQPNIQVEMNVREAQILKKIVGNIIPYDVMNLNDNSSRPLSGLYIDECREFLINMFHCLDTCSKIG